MRLEASVEVTFNMVASHGIILHKTLVLFCATDMIPKIMSAIEKRCDITFRSDGSNKMGKNISWTWKRGH